MQTQQDTPTLRRRVSRGPAWAMLRCLIWAMSAAMGLALAPGQTVLAGDAVAGVSYSLENPERISRLTVTVHKSQTIRIEQPFTEVLIGEPTIADVIPLTDRSLYVLGKKIGGTRLSILGKDKRLLGIVEIEVAYDAAAIEAQFKQSLPTSRIEATSVNGKIMLSGVVSDAIALEKAVAIASQYAPDAVTNSLTVAGSQQVLLEVRFVEASRTATRNLGVNWNVLSREAGSHALRTNLPGGVGIGAFPTTVLPFGALVARLLNAGTSAEVIIQALEEKGLARRLAEPNLVALSGDTASFLAGGEFPFPVGRENDTITIEFKKFGVGLGFTPTVLANGLINLKIEPEVSEIDPNNTLVVNDTTIPGLVTRRAKTTVELRDGQSFAIAGLLQANHTKARRQLPWLGQVPVLGALFRSASFEKQETDLVIIVTPRLVQPAGPGDRLVTPFDKSVVANDFDYFVKGKDVIPTWKARFRPKGKVNRRAPASGHMLSSAGPAFPSLPSYKGDITGSLPEPASKPEPRPAKKGKVSSRSEKEAEPEKTGLLGSLFARGGSLAKSVREVAFADPGPRRRLTLDSGGGA